MLKPTGLILGLAAFLALTACAKEEFILPGEREGIRDVPVEENVAPETEDASRNIPLTLPAAQSNAEWVQRISSPITRNAHPALGKSLNLAWSVGIGTGNGRRNRITADPVVAGGRVFALDARSKVTAVTTGGQTLWTRDLTPPNDSADDAGGGGLAFGNGKLFVSTGFGLLTALDPATGALLWQQNLRSTGTGSPTVLDGLVYLVSGDEIAWALDTETGRIRWQLSATPDINNVHGGPAPAVTEKSVIFAFGSGELQGAFRRGGLRLWDAQVAGTRPGYSGARVTDITGDPVVDGDRIYVGSHTGRTVALGLGNGKRLWTALHGALNPVWPAGGSIFMVTDRNELMRLSAEDGTVIWSQKLPFFTKDKPKRQTEIYGHFGPIIAGGRLIVSSSDGLLRFYDPATGDLLGTTRMPGGAATNPVVAGNTLYVVSAKGQLFAFR